MQEYIKGTLSTLISKDVKQWVDLVISDRAEDSGRAFSRFSYRPKGEKQNSQAQRDSGLESRNPKRIALEGRPSAPNSGRLGGATLPGGFR